MGQVKNAQYFVDNGIDFDEYRFATDASVVNITDASNVFTATNVETALKELFDNKFNKSGGNISGSTYFDSSKPITMNSWGSISVGSNGYVLFGQNCYINKDDNTYKYANTHSNIGAKGIVFTYATGENLFYFDMGDIATTKDATFTPSLKKIWYEGNQGSGSGMDADTVDGLQGGNIVQSYGNQTSATLQNNTTLASGMYTIADGSGLGLASIWWHIINMHHFDNNGYNAQIAIPLNNSGFPVQYRMSTSGAWSAWQPIGTPVILNQVTGRYCWLKFDSQGMYLQEI